MPHDFPYGVIVILGSGLIFVLYIIYYILRLAHLEMKDETPQSDIVPDESEH